MKNALMVTAFLGAGLCSSPLLAQGVPRPCAVVATFDRTGTFQEALIRKQICDAGSVLAVTVCSLDATRSHTVTISKSMLHKQKHKTYDILPDDVTVTVAKAASATSPACATAGTVIAPESDFDDGNLAKKQHGSYRYNGSEDKAKFDPDLDVAPPSGKLPEAKKK